MIEGTSVTDKFEKIYAVFCFALRRGLGVNDQKVNAYFEPDEYRVSFRNMVYIGDSCSGQAFL